MNTGPWHSLQLESTRVAAARLRALGFALCRVDPKVKKALEPGWSTRSIEPTDIRPGEWLGIQSGALSNGNRPGHACVIVDLDSVQAVERADRYLPPTRMVEGRPGKPRSHRYYLVPMHSIPVWAESPAPQAAAAARAATGHPGPFIKSFADRASKQEVIRWLGTGGQAVCPPSPHSSGELRVWETDEPGEPTVVEFLTLWDAVGQLASACGAAVPPTATFRSRASAAVTVVERARRYLAKIPGAIAGQGGHKQTFLAARILVWGFELSQAQALELLQQEYNPRCVPPWTDEQLRHKIEDADHVPFRKQRGWLVQSTERKEREGAKGSTATDERQPLANFLVQEVGSSDGKKRITRVGLGATAICENLLVLSGGWPRRVGPALFVPDGERGPLWLNTVADVFGWMQRLFPTEHFNAVHWADRSAGLVSRSEFDAFLRQQVPCYEAVESAPHEPPLPNHFYLHPPVAGGDGSALNGLVARLNPCEEEDELLIRAFLLTLVWGGPYGQRPAFLVTTSDDDPEMGRGAGKSTFIRLLARLVGGTFDVDPKEPWSEVIKRLLSNTACSTQRVILIDNVKTHRFSWSSVEALMTSDQINGRKMFVGDGRRPNTFTVAITLNGASLSKDLAQRCVIIKLARPKYTGNWEADTANYIESHRAAILGDLVAILRRPPSGIAVASRWGAWERDVLGRLPGPERLQRLIARRRDEADDDAEEASLIRDGIVNELDQRGFGDAKQCGVRITSLQMADIVAKALSERLTVTAASTKLRAMAGAIPELRKATYQGRKVWVWVGAEHTGSLAWLHDLPQEWSR